MTKLLKKKQWDILIQILMISISNIIKKFMIINFLKILGKKNSEILVQKLPIKIFKE